MGYSTNLGITTIATGGEAGTWGETTNINLGSIIEQSISGYQTQVVSNVGDTVLTIDNGSVTGVNNTARNMYLRLTGTLTSNGTVTLPATKTKLYFIFNDTTGGFAVSVKISGQPGTVISVANQARVVLASDGTNIVEALNTINSTSIPSGTTLASTSTSQTFTNKTINGANNVISNVSLTTGVTGTLPVANGGTGQSTYNDGQLLIGNSSGNTLNRSTLTSGTGVTITNGPGTITVSATGTGGTVTSVSASAPAFLTSTVTNPTTAPSIALTYSGTALPILNGGTGQTSLPGVTNAVLPSQTGNGGYYLKTDGAVVSWQPATGGSGGGTVTSVLAPSVPAFLTSTVANASLIPAITIGLSSSALPTTNGGTGLTSFTTNGAVYATSGSALTTGTLPVASGGTGQITLASGQYLIGNGTGGITSSATIPTSAITGTLGVGFGGTGQITLASGQYLIGNGTGGITSSSTIPTSAITGLLGVANGGTGAGTFTTGVLKGNGTSAITTATAGTDYVAPGGALGTPSSGTLSNCTVDGTYSVGFRQIPQRAVNFSVTGSVTPVLADGGKHYYITGGGAFTVTFNIPGAIDVSYPIGTVLTIVNAMSSNLTLSNVGITIYKAGAVWASGGLIAANNTCTFLKVATDTWYANGTGLT